MTPRTFWSATNACLYELREDGLWLVWADGFDADDFARGESCGLFTTPWPSVAVAEHWVGPLVATC